MLETEIDLVARRVAQTHRRRAARAARAPRSGRPRSAPRCPHRCRRRTPSARAAPASTIAARPAVSAAGRIRRRQTARAPARLVSMPSNSDGLVLLHLPGIVLSTSWYDGRRRRRRRGRRRSRAAPAGRSCPGICDCCARRRRSPRRCGRAAVVRRRVDAQSSLRGWTQATRGRRRAAAAPPRPAAPAGADHAGAAGEVQLLRLPRPQALRVICSGYFAGSPAAR